MNQNKNALVALTIIGFLAAGCGPSAAERAESEKKKLDAETKAREETHKASKAVTEMTDRMFRARTPEEEAKLKQEKERQVREILEAQKKADADAAKKPKP
jgi:hypothetical protein